MSFLAGCVMTAGDPADVQDEPSGRLAPGVAAVTESTSEFSYVRDADGTTFSLHEKQLAVSGELHQFAFRAAEALTVTVHTFAILQGWGERFGCGLVTWHSPAPFAQQLTYGGQAQSAEDGTDTIEGALAAVWGGRGEISIRTSVAGQEVIQEDTRVPFIPVFGESIGLGDRPDGPGRTFEMPAGSWLHVIAGGDGDPAEYSLTWSATVEANGRLDAYSLPPSAVSCGTSTQQASDASSQASVGNLGFMRDGVFSMRTTAGSYLSIEHLDRSLTEDPTSTSSQIGNYDFLGRTGSILKNTVDEEATQIRCSSPDPGDIEVEIAESAGSGTMYWLMADTAFLLLGPEVCADA